jgi:hypothetical protein
MSKTYQDDVKLLRRGPVVDEHLQVSGPADRAARLEGAMTGEQVAV